MKIYLTQNYAKYLESKNQIKECLELLEGMCEKLDYDNLIVGLCLQYNLKHQDYQNGIESGIKIYEKALKRFEGQQPGNEQLICIKFYKQFLRTHCMEIGLIRKLESLINQRMYDFAAGLGIAQGNGTNGNSFEEKRMVWDKSVSDELEKWAKTIKASLTGTGATNDGNYQQNDAGQATNDELNKQHGGNGVTNLKKRIWSNPEDASEQQDIGYELPVEKKLYA